MGEQLNCALPPVPPDAPLDMPVQNLREKPRARRLHNALRTHFARLIAFGGALVIGSLGAWQMRQAMGSSGITLLQWILLGLFSLTFYWVAFSATGGLAGLLPALKRKEQLNPNGGKIAIVMPVYGEDPVMTGSALLSMAEGLGTSEIADRAEIFIISDTQNADAWAAETAAFHTLRERSPLPVFYRKRVRNIGRKAGNVEQFVKRWGGRYAYMLMLDADSIMSAHTIVKMAARMDAEPRLGLLQTMPRLVGGESLLARAIQFAGALYGSVIARGVDAWQGNDGNYWGHNAMIRLEAFAQSCGMPVLKGRRPIGGHILSHDFVEAALMRRGGWAVRMDADLTGSYEGLPPTLEDFAGRERRWAQGNIQHLGVIGTKGLKWSNRVHFAIGIASYLMSPIWLLMMTVGMMITAQALFTAPEYFPLAHQLFPDWPTFDAKKMLGLFFAALGLLLLPKFAGWLITLCLPERRRRFGGAAALSKGFVLELLISTLYAPMMMLIQTRHIIDIILGRDSGWATQSRSGRLMPWGLALKRTAVYVIAGILPLAALVWLAPNQIIWLSPVLAGLLLAPWLARHSGDTVLGQKLAAKHFLLIPEEVDPPPVMRRALVRQHLFVPAREQDLAGVIADEGAIAVHTAGFDQTDPQMGYGDEDRKLLRVTAAAKIAAASTAKDALRYLDKQEKLVAAGDAELLQALHQLP